MEDLLGNVSDLIANQTLFNGTAWYATFTHQEVEHFLGDPDVEHAFALVMGFVAILYGKKLPHVLALVASVSFGLWTGLVIQDRQQFDQPLVASINLPEGVWVPVIAGLLAGITAGVLCKVAWKAALVLLTSALLMLIALALCRLFNVSPEQILQLGASALSAYRVVGAMVLVVAVLCSAAAVKRFHKHMITFASAFLGTLLLLSGISHFSARLGSDAPFSLLDDLARIISEVRGGRCHLWEHEEAHHLERCDCQEQCRVEILAWIASSATVLAVRWGKKAIPRCVAQLKAKYSEEERVPLSDDVDLPTGGHGHGSNKSLHSNHSPSAAIIGAPAVAPTLLPAKGASAQATSEETKHVTAASP